jgi:hypothetical protein
VIFPDDVSAVATIVSASAQGSSQFANFSIAGYDGIALSEC